MDNNIINVDNTGKYLPIGTVVLLNGGSKKVMIIGFGCRDTKTETIYDYSACMYPEGVITSNKTLLFNHSQIDKIFHFGMASDEDVEFKKYLKNVLS